MKRRKWLWIPSILLLCLAMLFQVVVSLFAYADYYQAYTGTGTLRLTIGVSTYKDNISASINASPNPIYVPGNMGAGIIKLRLYVSNSDSSQYWHHYTSVTIPIYGIDSNGKQTLCCNITISSFPPGSGSELYFGPFYLGQNYRGFKLGTPSASPAQYAYASASMAGYLTFEFYSLVFASTEAQFNTLSNNAANAYKNTIYNGQSAAYWAYQAAQGGADTTPPTIQKVQGLNGATCTTTGTFYVVVQATDNRAGQLQARARVDGGGWTGWYNIPASAIPVTLSSSGAHTITVEVKDVAGNTSQATMTAFKI